MEQEKPLDGGLLAWSTVIGGWVHQLVSSILCLNSSSLLTVAVTFGYTNSFGVYQDLYTRSNTASASAISWIGATVLHFCYGTSRWKTSWYGLLSPHYYCWIHNLCFFVSPLSFIGSPSPHHLRMFMLSICHEDKFYQLYLAQGLGTSYVIVVKVIPEKTSLRAVCTNDHSHQLSTKLAQNLDYVGWVGNLTILSGTWNIVLGYLI